MFTSGFQDCLSSWGWPPLKSWLTAKALLAVNCIPRRVCYMHGNQHFQMVQLGEQFKQIFSIDMFASRYIYYCQVRKLVNHHINVTSIGYIWLTWSPLYSLYDWFGAFLKIENAQLILAQCSLSLVKALAHYNWNWKKSSYRPYTLQLFVTTDTTFSTVLFKDNDFPKDFFRIIFVVCKGLNL